MSSQRTTDCDLPGGFLAIHTFLTAPNGVNASSSSYLVASLPRSPMYTCMQLAVLKCIISRIFTELDRTGDVVYNYNYLHSTYDVAIKSQFIIL